MTYPLPTLAATISPTGITAPSYADILLSLQASFRSIYGPDIVLTPDSQDGQLLAIFAAAINDSNNSAIATYASFSPSTAQGSALSSNVKINGLARLVPSNSSSDVTIIGQAGTIINDGVVEDDNGYRWTLPSVVTVPIGGSIIVTATCTTLGAITAAAHTITKIITPTQGWQTVDNAAEAVVGAPVESDATLRQRQAVSTALPAQTVLEGIYGAVANISGVQELRAYENDTNTTDSNGLPPHSISFVVNGGDALAIAEAIASKKSPGTATYGTTSEIVIDQNGVPDTIKFYVPTQVPIDIKITIKALTGYVSTTGAAIISALADYVSSLPIGGSSGYVFNSKLYSPANDTGLGSTYNVTAITARRDSDAYSTANIAIAFNELTTCVIGDIELTVT
jgi:uncharacterized phage protein gp47/JayE